MTEAFDWRWRSIRSAPKDGSHFLAIVMDGGVGFGIYHGALVPTQAVVHWWDNPGEEGFYTSVNELEPERPFPATHWQPLPKPPALLKCGCVINSGEFCAECY